MKKVSRRTRALWLLTGLIVVLFLVYVVRLAEGGRAWSAFPSNRSVYADGVLKVGTLTDRDGVMLATVENGARVYSDDWLTRVSTLHAVGDQAGNIGTGALSAFASRLIGYNFVTGVYSRTGAGETVALTLDAELNRAAYAALDGRNGVVGVMNYETGEIVCMVSAPSYDPNDPPDLTSGAYEGVYINRFLSSTYSPGSTFKLVTLAAAIDTIDDLSDRVFTCDGGLYTQDGYVACTGTHGEQSIEDALANSCNSAFGALALELGADKLAEYADKLGLTERGAVDGIKTAAGRFTKADDETADLAWSGIGQYEDAVCPYAMLRYVAAIAGGGVAPQAHLLKQSGLGSFFGGGGERLLSATTADEIAVMMNYNVYKTYGKDNFPGLELYAKSGTAEVGGGAAPHAWFVGFITNEDAPYAFVVVVENGGSGARVAGPVANAVLQAATAD